MNAYWVEFSDETGIKNEAYETYADNEDEVISDANARFIDSKNMCLSQNNILIWKIDE